MYRVWTRRRVLVAALLGLHVACVLAYALPPTALGVAEPWLELSAQRQRWAMFTPANTRNLAHLRLEHVAAGGDTRQVLLRDHLGTWSPRRARWLYLESALMNPRRRDSWVPAALPALATELLGDAPGRVRLTKLAYPLPLLEPDGTGNPTFTSGAAWADVAARLDAFPAIPVAEIER